MLNNHDKNNLKADHGAHSRTQTGKIGLLTEFAIFMALVAGISLLLSLVACEPVSAKPIATNTNNGYYIDLSKSTSGQASREILAFFVPVIGMDSQSSTKPTDTASQAHTCATRGQTIIYKVDTSPTDYDGLTLQNKTAERRICGAVSCRTESKTRHPISLRYSVAHTQKLQGGYHA